jgi:hypothetical protein
MLFKIKKLHTKKNISKTNLQQNLNTHGNRCFGTSTKGENDLLQLLKNSLNVDEYYLFNDLVVPSKINTTTEIDHVVVSNYGIFVIENKDYNASIYCSEGERRWTSVYGHKKYSFTNPLYQNRAHIKALQEALPFIDSTKFYSIAAFSRGAHFKKEIPADVFYYDQIPDVIKSITDIRINIRKTLLAIGKLSYLCQQPSLSREHHINNIKKKRSK